MTGQDNIVDEVQEAKKDIVENSTLQSLLEWDGSIDIKDVMNLPSLPGGRPAISITLRSLTSREMDKYRDLATFKGKNRTGRTIKDVDDDHFQLILLFNAIVEPNLKNASIQSKLNPSGSPEYIVSRMFLPGEQERMSRRVFEISGFDIDEDIKMKKSDMDLF